jgi:glycosyltransferase involved in cell wall biosynthesis
LTPSRFTLLVTTYERPDALEAVLRSVLRQSVAPDEVLIADDGSGESTRAVIERFTSSAPCPVVHVRQEHEGFRAARIRNHAVARASADYIVQIDGDMILHPQFLADHRAAAQPGCFVQGTRILADAGLTRRLLEDASRPDGPPLQVTPFSAGIGGLRRLYAAHLPWLSRCCMRLANGFIAIKGCNQGFWRADLERVAGYNETMTGWGSEDKELAARLQHAGVQRRTLLFAGIAVHLHHPPAARDRHSINEQILERTLRERRVRWDQ